MSKKKRNPNRNLADLLDSKRKFEFSDKQKEIIATILSEETNVVFIDGPAGTSKTYLAVYCALKEVLNATKNSILYIRTAAESGKIKLGARPGDISEKIHHLITPLRDKMDEIVPQAVTDQLFADKEEIIQAMPVNDVRGSSWTDKFVIVDEAQNFDKDELLTVITRLGQNSKIIFVGDSMQSDIKTSGWIEFLNVFSDYESERNGAFTFTFTEDDIVRNPFLKFVMSKLNKKRSEERLIKREKDNKQPELDSQAGLAWDS